VYHILDLSEKIRWSHYLKKLPDSQQDIYFTPEYYEVYENYKDGKARCFVFEDHENIAIYPFLQNSVNKLGYFLEEDFYDIQGAYGYNGVVSNCNEINFINKFHSAFNNFCKENSIIAEFTRFHPLIKNQVFSSGHLNCIKDRKTVYVNLSKTEAETWNNSYSSTNRNMIRKALKNNVAVSVCSDPDDYNEFYEIYAKTMQDLLASPYLHFNKEYFSDFRTLLAGNHQLILAKHNNEIVGGMILMFFKDYAHYHLSCRKREYGKFALNNLLLDFSIKSVRVKGCKFFHLGGGTSSSEKDLLFKFKANFSNNLADFVIGKKIHNEHIYSKILSQWQEKFKESYEKNKSKLLGYRDIDQNEKKLTG
jgi:lipid II:glycine glycyltransferase (peptidoglycan interpeptide bridge formation enzyme)